MTTDSPQKSAKAMQEQSERTAAAEEKLAVALRAQNNYEYHLNLPRSVVEGILDPEIPDCFIEVPCPVQNMRRFLHTSYVKEVDVRGL